MAARVGRRLSVLIHGCGDDTVFPLRRSVDGQCSRVASALVLRRSAVVGISVFVISEGVGASLGVLAFKRARRQSPGETTCWTNKETQAAPKNKETILPNDSPVACCPSPQPETSIDNLRGQPSVTNLTPKAIAIGSRNSSLQVNFNAS